MLTKRETQFVEYAAQGLANKQIADKMGISIHTAKNHSDNARHKLKTATKLETVLKCLKTKIITL
jgi:DNA-binding CsgD family transcriptional regulator